MPQLAHLRLAGLDLLHRLVPASKSKRNHAREGNQEDKEEARRSKPSQTAKQAVAAPLPGHCAESDVRINERVLRVDQLAVPRRLAKLVQQVQRSADAALRARVSA